MMRKNGMQQYNCEDILRNINRKNDIDDSTFFMWKSELQKELSSFWESIL
jgi:hypothetical protein